MGSIDSSRHMQHMRHRPGPRRMAIKKTSLMVYRPPAGAKRATEISSIGSIDLHKPGLATRGKLVADHFLCFIRCNSVFKC
ncbi:Leucine--tRNA ligase [Fusarium oxysporum f. sp. albedinis]|nr:Leucine--tRNA ligase [Fusarium oxysporum f. sp. albedinis]